MERSSAIILRKENKVLMHHRDDHPEVSHPGCWSFIGGWLNPGEDKRAGLLREIEEEIPGCKIRDITYLGQIYVPNDGYNAPHYVNFFRGETDAEAHEIDLKEGQGVAYYNFEEMNQINVIPHVKQFVIDYKEKLF